MCSLFQVSGGLSGVSLWCDARRGDWRRQKSAPEAGKQRSVVECATWWTANDAARRWSDRAVDMINLARRLSLPRNMTAQTAITEAKAYDLVGYRGQLLSRCALCLSNAGQASRISLIASANLPREVVIETVVWVSKAAECRWQNHCA